VVPAGAEAYVALDNSAVANLAVMAKVRVMSRNKSSSANALD
jgi:hypothetical protein